MGFVQVVNFLFSVITEAWRNVVRAFELQGFKIVWGRIPQNSLQVSVPYETDGDARRLAQGCKFWILV